VITKQDILDRAAEWRLRPEVVEKDYVLGWLLAGIATLPMSALWIFKGGTCVKKCFFETYRFSEDLDFSLQPDAPYTHDELLAQLRALTARVADLSGLEFPPDLVAVKPRQNKEGQQTFEGRVAYRGPLAYPGSPKVRFDITRHEVIIAEPAERSILHPYPDALPGGAVVLTYSFEELLAEKTRALLERSRPRDLYDVVHLLENAPSDLDLVEVRRLFAEKCSGKGITVPSSAELMAAARIRLSRRAPAGGALLSASGRNGERASPRVGTRRRAHQSLQAHRDVRRQGHGRDVLPAVSS
jgi:predicted nucleotidyltransferase component of viral defense system